MKISLTNLSNYTVNTPLLKTLLVVSLLSLAACHSDGVDENPETSLDSGSDTDTGDAHEENNDSNLRYENEVFESVDLETDIPFATVTTQGGEEKNLMMDIYMPANDSETSRPVVVFAHGGGFVYGHKGLCDFIAAPLARAGYVVASISYRLIDVTPTVLSSATAVIDGMNDMKAAVRFLKNEHERFGIDPEKVIIGGYSAGSFIGLHYAYVQRSEEVETLGGPAGALLKGYFDAQGGSEGNSGNEGSAFPILAVYNFAGALGDASLIEEGEAPLFSIHGDADEVVAYGSGDANGTGLSADGSAIIHQELDNVGVMNELMTIEGGAHDAIQVCEDCMPRLMNFLKPLLSS